MKEKAEEVVDRALGGVGWWRSGWIVTIREKMLEEKWR